MKWLNSEWKPDPGSGKSPVFLRFWTRTTDGIYRNVVNGCRILIISEEEEEEFIFI